MDLTTLERLPLWIGGGAVVAHTTRYAEVINPATGEVLRHVPLGDADDVAAAAAAAAAALAEWRSAPALRRARVLMRFRDLMETHKKDLSRLVSQEHGKTVIDAEGSITRGIEVVEFATGIPHLLKGEFSDNAGTGVDSFSLRQPVGRLRGHHAVQLPGDGADVDVPRRDRLRQHVHPQAIRAGSDDESAHGGIAARCRTTGRRVQRRARRQGSAWTRSSRIRTSRRFRLSGRRRLLATSTRPARATASGCRRWAAPRITRSSCPMPISPWPRSALIGAAYGSAGERCMAVSVAVAVGDAGDPLCAQLAERAQRVKVGPGEHPDVRDGPGDHLRCARSHRRPHRSRRRRRRDAGRRRQEAERCAATSRILRRPHVVRPRDAPT